ncbi:hypothetical protein [Streptomyces phaeoluteigriseus]
MTGQSAVTVRARYAEQAASDLKENRRRQRELLETAKMLKREEALLADILALAERHEGGVSEPPPLPEQAQQENGVPRPGRPIAGADKATKTAAKGRAQQPLLADLLLDLLRARDEPRFAKELRDELLAKHPDRAPTPQVVRNTLESLVAKRRIRRHKDQPSVTYTLA